MQNYPPGSDYNQVVNAQVAIWEILSEDAGLLGSGQVSFSAWEGEEHGGYGKFEDAQAIVTYVVSHTSSINAFDTTGFKLVHNEIYQDYMVVPEPPTILLLGGGLIGLLAFRKKFKFNRKGSNGRI